MSVLGDLISAITGLLTTAAPLTADQQAALTRYGGYQLQWGDNDVVSPPVYEGQGRTPPDPLPAEGSDGYVTTLQKDLASLGIMPAKAVTGVFDRATSWQVREFQIYAGMDTVATVDSSVQASLPRADQLTTTANAAQYTGEINGRLDGPTAVALQAWIANGYACPVVAETRDSKGALTADNVWLGSDDPTSGHRCWVTDLTGTYTVDPARIAAQGAVATGSTHPKILIGSYISSNWGNGPVCQQGTEWTDNTKPQGTDITIQTLTGDTLSQASAATTSTYKVIRAVAHVESPDNFDALNAYDVGRVSVSPYHFTLFSKGSAAEMPAFLSYLAATLPDEYAAALARYGISTAQAWPTDGSDPVSHDNNPLYITGARKWATFPQQVGLQTAAGTVSAALTSVTSGDDADYFRTWHWIYRWVMACRMYPDIWLKCWDLCRWRIQALLAAPIAGVAGLADGTTLGEVYTSEYAVTAIVRAHVNAPAAVIAAAGASKTIKNSLTSAITADPSLANNLANWSDAQHQAVDQALVTGLINTATSNGWAYGTDLNKALGYVSDVGAAVSTTAGSFEFDPP